MFAHECDPESGTLKFGVDNRAFLVMQSEVSDSDKARAVSDLLQLDHFTISKRVNVGDQKDYGEVYAAFKRRLAMDADYLDRMYATKAARHFYSTEQLAGFRAGWERLARG